MLETAGKLRAYAIVTFINSVDPEFPVHDARNVDEPSTIKASVDQNLLNPGMNISNKFLFTSCTPREGG
jgi:hypothetical protein